MFQTLKRALGLKKKKKAVILDVKFDDPMHVSTKEESEKLQKLADDIANDKIKLEPAREDHFQKD